MDPANSKKRYLISYTVLFTAILAVVSCFLLLSGRSLVLGGDPVAQHVRALIYYSRWLRELPGYLLREHCFPAYSLSMGYGSDVITTLHFYVVGDPLNLLSALVPTKYISVFYTVMIVLRMYLVGLSFSYMCFTIRKPSGVMNTGGNPGGDLSRHAGGNPGGLSDGNPGGNSGRYEGGTGILAGALTCVFSAFTIFGGWRHPFFLNPLIYMPLIIAGAEKIRTQKKHLLFALAVAVSAMSNFYFFYMIVVATMVYVLWKCVCVYGKDLKRWITWIGHLAGAAVTGVLTAGVILLPVLFAFAGNPRSVEGYIFDRLYTADYYLKFPASLITFWSAGEWGYVGISSISLLAVLALFAGLRAGRRNERVRGDSDRSRSRRGLPVLFLMGTAALLVPSAGYLLNGFSYVSNRWVWAYVLLCAWMTAEGWEELRLLAMPVGPKPCDGRIQNGSGIGKEGRIRRGFFAAAVLIAAVLLLLSFRPVYAQIRVNLWIQLGLMCAGLLILWTAGRNKAGRTSLRMAAVFALMTAGICCNGLFGIIPSLGGVGNGYYAWGRVAGEDAEIFRTESAAIRAMEGADGFYRYSGKDLSGNSSVQDGAPSTQFYWSLANGYVADFLDKLGLCSSYVVAYANLDDRTILNEAAGVTLFYAQDEAHVPYGYELLDRTQNPQADAFPIYRNRYALPLGITYDAVIREADFNALDPGARQEILLSRAVVPDDFTAGSGSGSVQAPLTEVSPPRLTRQKPSFTAHPLKGKAVVDGNTITVLEEDAKIRFRFEGTENSESGLYLGGLDYLPESGSLHDLPERLKIQVKAYAGKEKKMTRTLSWFTRKEKWYGGRNSFMFSGGYHEEKLTSFVLTLPARGVYTFSEIAVYTQPLGEDYARQAAALKAEAPDYVDLHTSADTLTWATGRVDAHVELSAPKLLCMQMAYSKGWKAFVDGKEVPAVRTNLMFTGVMLDAGEHDIVLRYTTPGLLPGLCMTILGLLIMVCCTWKGMAPSFIGGGQTRLSQEGSKSL